MAGIARSGTAAWVPSGPTMRPFRFGDQHHPDPDPELRPGTMVGDRYRVVQLLGEGGMGRVYEVEHTFLGRRCALKALRRDALKQPENVRRFQQEAMAASRIGHVAIVEVIDFATLPDGQVFMVMELLSGESLESWMGRPGNLAEIIPHLVEIAEGLDAAHTAGVLHRDIKPANLFLARTTGGRVSAKILDFGIAKMTDRGADNLQTEAGAVLGTPYYLAPERAMGAAVDARADLYSLGVILYELLTGNVPFEAESFMEILGKHVNNEPLDPRQAAPERPIPDGIARLAMKLLAKDPAERPANARAVALEFSQIQRTEAEALRAVVTGPRSLQSLVGDSTRVLEEIGERRDSPGPVVGAPMASFADRSSPPSSTTAASSSRMTAIALLLGFAAVGAVGGLGYLELASASPDAREVSTPGVDRPPASPVSTAAPERPPPLPAPVGGGDDPGGEAGEGGEGDEGVESAAPSRPSGDKTPAQPSLSGKVRSASPKKGKDKPTPREPAQDAAEPKPPDPGPTIKDDIYED